MRVSTRSWHGRVYRWWCNHPKTGFKWNFRNVRRRRDNLCHYVRVVAVYAPLLWFFTAAPTRRARWLRPWMPVSAVGSAALLVVGILRWPAGTWRVAWTSALAVTCVVALAALVVGLEFLVERRNDRKWEERERRFRGEEPPDRGPSFARVAWEFLKAKKRRVCPFIEVVEEP